MKIFQQHTEFDYSWEEVSTSNWRKYGPWNKLSTHVIAVDTLSRAVDPETGIVSFLPFARVPQQHRANSVAHSCERNGSSPANNPRQNG